MIREAVRATCLCSCSELRKDEDGSDSDEPNISLNQADEEDGRVSHSFEGDQGDHREEQSRRSNATLLTNINSPVQISSAKDTFSPAEDTSRARIKKA